MSLRHALAGLHAGILGTMVMLACLMAGSLVDRRSVWLVPNLFATTFFGSDAYMNQYMGSSSWAGLAVLFAIYGALGVIWGCGWRDQKKTGLVFFGGVAGLAIYFLLFDLVWRHLNPLIALYAPDRQLEIGHILWGMVLARSPRYAREISARLVEEEEPATAAYNGEVIL